MTARPASFDSPEDFARNDVRSPGGVAVLRRLPVMVSCGADDPFEPQVARLRQALDNPAGSIDSGCHDVAYWRRHIPDTLAFVGTRLGR